jgi:hypothetical protein
LQVLTLLKPVSLSEPHTTPPTQIVDQINTVVARQLAAKFEPVQGLLDVVSPALSKVLQSNIATSIASLKKMPGLLGYQQTGGGLTTYVCMHG